MPTGMFPLSALAVLAFGAPLACATVDYTRDVKPILAEHCYRCHGARQQKSGLRMDTVAFMRAGGDTGPALKTGQTADDTVLLQVILGTHDDVSQMPYKKPALRENQVTIIRAWLAAGAPARS